MAFFVNTLSVLVLSCWWKAKTYRNVCVRVFRRKSIIVWTQRQLLKIGGMRFYILKIRLENLLKPFSWRLRKIASFWSEALCFKNKRAEPRHVTMISHCGILLFINAKVTINARKLTYNCCWNFCHFHKELPFVRSFERHRCFPFFCISR